MAAVDTEVAAIDRAAMAARYRANRARTKRIYATLAPEAYTEAPIPLRRPFVFYDGHIPAFAFLTLCRDALGEPSVDLELERLFNRGIDPSVDGAPAVQPVFPPRDVVERFGAACDARVLAALEGAEFVRDDIPALVRGEAAFNVLEHEDMHDETLIYIIRRMDRARQRGPRSEHRDQMPRRRDPIAIPAGRATIGARRDALPFGWDNEFEEIAVDVAAFAIDAYDVTNGEWLAFVEAGGPVPPQWFERDGTWMLRAVYEDLPLPHSWPVYVRQIDAAAYCAWKGARLPTEAEYHRAAFGTPGGDERVHPWGDEAPDPARHGNFGWRRFDPEPSGSSPAGASAFGVEDLVGNGWEWTATPFAPLPGFRPMDSYSLYSKDFFDGKHMVLKGASPVTAAALVRRSLRNWFYADYPYMDATFRCVRDR